MYRFAYLVLAVGLTFVASSQAQQSAKIFYRDRSVKPERTADVTGNILEESVNGIKLKPQIGADREFLVSDIVEVQYSPPTVLVIPMNRISKLESDLKKASGDAAKIQTLELEKEYKSILAGIKDEKSAPIKRHIQYRLLQLRAILAGDAVDQQLQTIELFDKFRKENPNAWQLLLVVRQQAQMLADVNKLDEAAKALEETAKTPKLGKEIKQELELMLIDALIRAGKSAEVEGRIGDALSKLPPDDPLVPRLKIYQLSCQATKGNVDAIVTQLKDMIDKSPDAGLKALAYNTLGDCYNAKAQKKEALWAYMWVDVVYNQDKVEYGKAIERLSRVFKDLGDDVRAERYREKMKSVR